MASVNKCIFIGNLTKDPEVKYMANGEAVANCSIACNEKWKNKAGEKQESVEYINLVLFRRLAEVAGEYLKKGAEIYIEGKLTTEKYEKDGVTRYTTKIIVNEMKMLGSKRDEKQEEKSNPAEHHSGAVEQKNPTYGTPGKAFENFDDDIPF